MNWLWALLGGAAGAGTALLLALAPKDLVWAIVEDDEQAASMVRQLRALAVEPVVRIFRGSGIVLLSRAEARRVIEHTKRITA